ncbi:hypothetical protein AVEN_154377-1 [Araneus ventricosus]|uniref:Uncharacterized protein n=1 Tax=Araneus ventricosus TaxID=182803 RepID=A0A4Y2Q779_ARAVE|nr:hypothetical protein AVEN_2466-1 [Araneus ventricosus]GBN58943.1 hypothetical protein AVEN_154377-1 [Araneus ventricosus]
MSCRQISKQELTSPCGYSNGEALDPSTRDSMCLLWEGSDDGLLGLRPIAGAVIQLLGCFGRVGRSRCSGYRKTTYYNGPSSMTKNFCSSSNHHP